MRKNIYLKCAAIPFITAGLLSAVSAQAKVKAPLSPQIVQSQDGSAQERLYFPESNLYQKPGSPVRYSYSIPKNIQVGQSVTVDVTLSEPFSQGDLIVTCRTRGDVTLHGSASDSFSMAGNSAHEMQVTFTAGSEGRHYIQFQAVSETPEQGAYPRYFSIPVQVGPVQAQKPNPNLRVMPNGDAVIAMPAQEVIR